MNNIKINLINLESTDCVIFDNIKFKFRKFCNLLIFKNLPLPPPKGE